MPLISSPVDGSPMREIERYGVRIDVCQTSGGIWLDKGELEKIILMIREEALREAADHGAAMEATYEDDADAYETHPGDRRQRPQRRKRESVFENLMDIFDL